MNDPARALWREPLRSGTNSAPHLLSGAHHLIAAPPEVPDRRAPHMDETGEREDEEDRHAEEEVQLEDRISVRNERRHPRSERQDPLRPGHELHHLLPVEMLKR